MGGGGFGEDFDYKCVSPTPTFKLFIKSQNKEYVFECANK